MSIKMSCSKHDNTQHRVICGTHLVVTFSCTDLFLFGSCGILFCRRTPSYCCIALYFRSRHCHHIRLWMQLRFQDKLSELVDVICNWSEFDRQDWTLTFNPLATAITFFVVRYTVAIVTGGTSVFANALIALVAFHNKWVARWITSDCV